MSRKLRPYQLLAADGTTAAYHTHRSAMVVMATGLGKSVLIAEMVLRAINSGQRVMIMAHRERLIRQLARTMETWCGVVPDIEMADERANEHTLLAKSPIVISTIQTQAAGDPPRRERFNPDEFGLIVVDETHRALSKSYRETIAYYMDGNPRCKLFGVTATADRADGRAMGMLYECVPFSMDILQGRDEGYLVPIVSLTKEIKSLSLDHIRKVRGDLDASTLAERLEQERPTQEITTALTRILAEDLGECKQTIAFTHRVAHAHMIAGTLERVDEYRGAARVIHGGTPDDERDQIYMDFEDKRYPLLLNCDVLTEGYDCPEIRCVVVAKPTMSRGRFVQMVGRGLRPLPGVIDALSDASADDRKRAIAESAKPDCLVVIISGHGSQHDLVTTADLLGGRYSNPEVAKRAKKKAAKSGRKVDMDELLAEAAAELIEEERRREERKNRRLLAQAEIVTRKTDLFGGGFDGSDPQHAKRLRQIEVLRKAKVPENVIARLSDAELKRVSAEIVRRWKSGLCSYWQARKLRDHGIDPKEVRYEDAKRMLDEIKAGKFQGASA